MSDALLAFHDVGLVIGGARLFEALSFELGGAERIAIVADTGRGKTLIARLALGFLAPSSGAVTLLGSPIGCIGPVEQRRIRVRSGVALQGGSLFGALSVEDNLALAFGGASRGTLRALRRRIDRLLVDFRIEHCAATIVGNLSTGEQRRVELARAFVRDPDLVILDEPFEGASAQTVALEEQVRRHVVGRARAMLLLTQNAELAHRLAQRVYRLDRHGSLQQVETISRPAAASAENAVTV